MRGDVDLLGWPPAGFRQGDERQVLNAGYPRKDLDVLHHQELVTRELCPDIEEGIGSGAVGSLAVGEVRGGYSDRQGVPAAVTDLDIDELGDGCLTPSEDGDGDVFQGKLSPAGE